MSNPTASVLWAPGTNCHHETVRALELAGASAKIVHLPDMEAGRAKLTDCDLLVIPGGFSYGDHIAAGAILATVLSSRFADQLRQVVARKTPILGICNGFQVLVRLGLLPGNGTLGTPTAILDVNKSARFEHWRRTAIHFPDTGCVWTKHVAGKTGTIPVAHGEGRFVLTSTTNYCVAATYADPATADYPKSPNGGKVAGVCNHDKTILGMMPHPERVVNELHGGSFGLMIFEAGVEAVRG